MSCLIEYMSTLLRISRVANVLLPLCELALMPALLYMLPIIRCIVLALNSPPFCERNSGELGV